jgi:di/tricarboxylate transporter
MPSLAVISVGALAAAIVLSCFSRINVGVVSIALAFAIGAGLGGMKATAVVAGFPISLFLTLTGVTLLFAQARANGTLAGLTARLVRLARGNAGLIPILFFVLAALLATAGAGNIAATALLAPLAMTAAAEAGISGFLMALMVCNGASAGAFSPVAPTGIIANTLMAKAGIEHAEWRNYFNTLLVQSAVAFAGYFLCGGWRLFAKHKARIHPPQAEPFDSRQKLTLAVLGAFVASILAFHADLTAASFCAAVLLTLSRAADEEAAISKMPWHAILMVSGVTMLISILERTGGMDLFTSALARFSTPKSVTFVIALVTGVISVYSSSSGVVLPAFLPTIPSLVSKMGGGDPLSIAYSINVGAHLVDVSPLSTLGALCIACVAAADRDRVFRQLMLWGLSMTVAGAAACYLFFGVL